MRSERPPGLKISAALSGGDALVRLAGEVDRNTSPDLRTRLHELLRQRPARMIVDLARVSYMDSSGVGTMVEIKRLVERQAGRLILAALQPRVRSVFEITQLDKFFTLVSAVDEARSP